MSKALSGKCKLIVLLMDTKRRKTFKHKIAAGKTAYQIVVDLQPVVVITADDNAAKHLAWVDTHTRKLSNTYNEWMMPYSVIGYTKIEEEHGEWAAASALAILGGLKASDIPLVTNRRWDT